MILFRWVGKKQLRIKRIMIQIEQVHHHRQHINRIWLNSRSLTERYLQEKLSPNPRLIGDNESGEQDHKTDASVQETPMDMILTKLNE